MLVAVNNAHWHQRVFPVKNPFLQAGILLHDFTDFFSADFVLILGNIQRIGNLIKGPILKKIIDIAC